jgi:hypothetical protein
MLLTYVSAETIPVTKAEFSTCRLPTAELIVRAGVLKDSWQSEEESLVVRDVVEVFLHEEFNIDTYVNDIAIIKVGIIFKWELHIPCIFSIKMSH